MVVGKAPCTLHAASLAGTLPMALRSASQAAALPSMASGPSLCCARAIEWGQGFRGQQTLKTPSAEARARQDTPTGACGTWWRWGGDSPSRASGAPVTAEPCPAHTGEGRPESGRDGGKKGSWMSHQVPS